MANNSLIFFQHFFKFLLTGKNAPVSGSSLILLLIPDDSEGTHSFEFLLEQEIVYLFELWLLNESIRKVHNYVVDLFNGVIAIIINCLHFLFNLNIPIINVTLIL